METSSAEGMLKPLGATAAGEICQSNPARILLAMSFVSSWSIARLLSQMEALSSGLAASVFHRVLDFSVFCAQLLTCSIRQAWQICSLLSLLLIFCAVQRSLSLRILLRQELRCLKLKRVYCTECLGESPIKKDNTRSMLSAAKTCASSWICW